MHISPVTSPISQGIENMAVAFHRIVRELGNMVRLARNEQTRIVM